MLRSIILMSLLTATGALVRNAKAIPPEISFCPAGVHADGFVDWTRLPALSVANFSQLAPAVDVTIPVSGVPNLNARVQIASSYPLVPNSPYYAVNSSADLAINAAYQTPITITFSKPVKGVSVVIRSYGRFGHNFAMTANDVNGNTTAVGPPPPAQVDTNGWDFASDQYSTAPLQILSNSANLTTITFGFTGNDNEYAPFELINLRVESGSGPDLSMNVPRNGLTRWFRSDKVILQEQRLPYLTTPISVWPDQSGNGADAGTPNQASAPKYILDGPHCTPVLAFNGGQSLTFLQSIDGWTGMTVVIASQSYADPNGLGASALFWNEIAPWGATFFSPFQTHLLFRFGTQQVDNQPVLQRTVDIGGDFSITTAVHRGATDLLYVNGVLSLEQDGKVASIRGTGPVATIGGGYNHTFFQGNVGEILIYDRALTDTEREEVEHYLMSKFGAR